MSKEAMASSAELRTAADDLAKVCTSRRCTATLRSVYNKVVRQPLPADMVEQLGKLK